MENLKCETKELPLFEQNHGFAKIKSLFKKDIELFKLKNQQNWDKLRQRHESNVFSVEIPLCLQIRNPSFIVKQYCTDEHVGINEENFDFYIDVVPIVEEYIVALLLAEGPVLKLQKKTKIMASLVQYQIITSVRNPITQCFFNPSEMLFFSKLFSQKTSDNDKVNKLIRYGLHLSGAVSKLSQFIGNETIETVSWFTNQSLYWFQQKTLLRQTIKTHDFIIKLQATLALFEQKEEEEAPSIFTKLKQLWMVTSNQSQKISKLHTLIGRSKTILKPMIECVLSLSFLLPNIISCETFTMVANFICSDFMFSDSFGFIISQLFGVILPLNSQYKFDQQIQQLFQPFEYLQHEAIESIRRKVWEPLSRYLDHFHDYDELKNYTRDIFNRIFESYLDENIKQIHPKTDLFFNAALLMDLNVVKIIFKKHNKHNYSKLRKVGNKNRYIYIYIRNSKE